MVTNFFTFYLYNEIVKRQQTKQNNRQNDVTLVKVKYSRNCYNIMLQHCSLVQLVSYDGEKIAI